MKSKVTDSKVDLISSLIDEAYGSLRDLIESEELDVYLDREDKIREHKVEVSEDIEAAHVAALGAYSIVSSLKKTVDAIKAGKVTEKPARKKAKKTGVIGIQVKGGKASVIGDDMDLPPELKRLLKKFMKSVEEEL